VISRPGILRSLLLLPAAALALSALSATDGTAATPSCLSFRSQADAQDYFVTQGGPRQRIGNLDPDRDGVACEELSAPFKGFATIGYSLKRQFFYGVVRMPPAAAGAAGGDLSCLYGNRHFAEGPRQLKVYRARPGPDLAVTDAVGAAAEPSSSSLIWKANKKALVPGRYYAAFEERIPLSPYGANECPGFQSAEVLLPKPQSVAS
jgi:hypothetical protein